jgi:aspartyl-tRNA(Asn)/glutamyl-tRNA(Gln) amidotransferase subunit A
MTGLHELTATELVELYAAGDASPVEVAHAVLAQLDAVEPVLNAFYAIEPELALTAAAASERRWREGHPAGPIDGVPLTLKENMATAGTPLPSGTAAWSDAAPASADGPVASLAAAAGGIRLGKTVMPDLGMLSSGVSSLHGVTRSPWNRAWTVGGSSGGAGAAAAAGVGPLHLGSDIGGSVRLPAGWLGLVALKPTFGVIPVDSPYLGRAYGPITRTVDDAALLMSAVGRPDPRDHTQVPHGLVWADALGRATPSAEIAQLRIGLQLDAGWGTAVDPEVAAIVSAAAAVFADAGARVESIGPLVDAELLDSLDRFLRVRSQLDIERMPEERRGRLLPFIVDWARTGAELSGLEVLAAYQDVQALRSRTVRATLPYDLVLSPVSPGAAFPAEWPMPSNDPRTSLHHIGFTAPYNFSDQPASSINAGFTADGRPVGLQIAGRRFADTAVLRATKWFESARPSSAVPNWPFTPDRGSRP